MREKRKRRKSRRCAGLDSPPPGGGQLPGKDERQRAEMFARVAAEGRAAAERGDFVAVNSPRDLDEFFSKARLEARKIVKAAKGPPTRKDREG